MHVSSAFRYDQLSAHVGTAQSRMLEAQNRVITGKRINAPSDDASGTKQLVGMSALRSGIAAYTKNLDVAKGVLSSTEAAYSDLGDMVQQAQTLTIQGATNTTDQSGLANLADQIKTIQDRLVTLANAQAPDGRYVFGGQMTDAKPFSVDGDGVLTYAGNNTVPTMETGPGESVKVGETGGKISDLYSKLTELQKSLRSGSIQDLSNNRLAELKDSMDSLTAARGDVGRRMNAIESTRTMHERRDVDLKDRASEVGEIDYASAILEYTAANSAYEAALQVASKGFSMGLMDFIR